MNRYRIIRTIKRGWSSEVLEGVMQGEGALERRVAIKRLLDPEGEHVSPDQFVDEARIVSQLHHANIVDLYDFGVENGQPYLVLEYVDGLDLAGLADLAEKKKRAFPLELALHVVVEIAQALAYAHEARNRDGEAMGIIHRDVNPSNILVSWTGDVRLTDFGIARAASRFTRTAVGTTKGTLHYMAPEQVSGGTVDARTDLFALGCVLHRLIAGYSPVERGGSLEASLSEDLAQIIGTATQAKPRDRYRDARAMAADAWRALSKRLDRDARGALVEWLRSLREEKPAKKIRDMFDAGALRDLASEQPIPAKRAKTVRPAADSGEHATRFDRPVADTDQHHAEDELPETEEHASQPAIEEVEIKTMIASELDTTINFVPDTSNAATVGLKLHDMITPRTPADGTLKAPAPPPTAADPYLGKVLHGYKLTALLGSGSWTRVYRAEHQFLQYECAIKVAATTSKNIAARIMREAQQLSKISHPNVVSVKDCGITESGAPFFTMELIEGRTLHDAVSMEAPFSVDRAKNVLRQIALALSEAHRHGLVHRDLKPANIMLSGELEHEDVKVLDFGLVRLLAPTQGEPLTGTNQILGTPAYMSPEQIQGEQVGPESDLYSLGVILFEMLSGGPPFRGLNVIDTMHQHMNVAPPTLPPSGGLEELAYALLAKSPGARIRTADELITRLDAIPISASALKPIVDLEIDTVKPEPNRPTFGSRAGEAGPPDDASPSRLRVRVTPVIGSGPAAIAAPPPIAAAAPSASMSRALSALEQHVESSEPLVRVVTPGAEDRTAPHPEKRGALFYAFLALVIALVALAILLMAR